VFIPFILMTVIVTLLLYFFGLNATTGTINYSVANINKPSTNNPYTYYNPDTQNNNSYNNTNLQNNTMNRQNSNTNIPPPPLYISSSPAFQSL